MSEMVFNTPTITLAKVTSIEAEGSSSTAHFETVKAIRGNPARAFSLSGYPSDDEDRGHFSGHTDPEFWTLGFGNTVWPGDCRAYGVFKTGEMYLVFLDGPNYPKSFENIRSQDDLWYRTIVVAADALR